MRTGAGIVTGTGENTNFMGLLMGKINGKELEKRCGPSEPARRDSAARSMPLVTRMVILH